MPFDPELVRELSAKAKKQIRARMRALRRALPAQAAQARSNAICQAILELDAFREASALALYCAMEGEGEVDVRAVDEAARRQDKAVYYPFMQRTERGTLRTGFRRTLDVGDLSEAPHGFLQPSAACEEAKRGSFGFVIVPACAVSGQGLRVGFGSGFYDATLPEFCPPARSAAVVYDFQLLAELPGDAHDVACDWIVTDRRTLAAVPL